MKTKLTILTIIFAGTLCAQKVTKIIHKDTLYRPHNSGIIKELCNKLIIVGIYNSKDLMIKDSFGKNGIGYCVTEVKINGKITSDETSEEIFKINLSDHQFKKGDKFELTILYKDSCGPIKEPLLMNPGSIKADESSGNNSLIIEGKNFNSSLFVVNPRSVKGYGIKEVIVNGKKVSTINSDILEVNFFKLGIPYEEKLKIEFKYENGSDPFIINPEVINY
ncbi:MAG: hypothetical protein ACK5QC_01600 [Bacteroidota bacterium]|jgi:hypothetical protein